MTWRGGRQLQVVLLPRAAKQVAEWIFQMKGKNVIFCTKPVLN
jgi:hypothetical protein